MMDRILEDLYYGKLLPHERKALKGDGASRIATAISSSEAKLRKGIPPELVPELDRLLDAQAELQSVTAEACWTDGFRIGARIIAAALGDGRES